MIPRAESALLLSLSFLLSGCAWAVLDSVPLGVPNLNYEGPNPYDSFSRGNCIEEARTQSPTPFCPIVVPPEGIPFPPSGIRILDSTYSLPSASTLNYQVLPPVIGSRLQGGVEGSFNFQRSTEDLFPDTIVPGLGAFFVFYGIWNDTNGDGWILWNWSSTTTGPCSLSCPAPRNEWVGLHPARIVTFVEPGSHPGFDDARRTVHSFEPDIVYTDHSCYLTGGTRNCNKANLGGYTQDRGYTVFLDGSLFSSLRTVTIAPAPFDGTPDTPYVLAPDSLIDFDEYLALSPTPLSTLWEGTVGGFIDERVGSPSFGVCPTPSCKIGPVNPSDLPWVGSDLGEVGVTLDSLFSSAESNLFSPYLPEYLPGSNSSAEGHTEEIHFTYFPWIDMLLEYAPFQGEGWVEYAVGVGVHPNLERSLRSPLPKGKDGKPFMPPGHLTGTIWIGGWKDLNGDGHVGRASVPDPYEGGMRPLADDYLSSAGEFVPGRAYTLPFSACGGRSAQGDFIRIRIFPDSGDYSDLFPHDALLYKGGCSDPVVSNWPPEDRAYPLVCSFCNSFGFSSGQYVFGFRSYANKGSGSFSSSLAIGPGVLAMPWGSLLTGFTVCAGPILVRYEDPGSGPREESVFDCDHVEKADPEDLLSLGSLAGVGIN